MLPPEPHILLTGASGFLGTAIARELMQGDAILHTLGRKSSNEISCDLIHEVPSLPSPIDVVIHAMGKAHMVPQNAAEAQAFFDVNLQGTVNICKALDGLPKPPGYLVFISTVAVYGLEEGTGITEDRPLAGNTPYAKSKIEAEQYLQAWCEKRGVKLSILRLPLIAGQHAPGNLGAMEKAIARGRYFNIGRGNARKSMVLASDIGKWVLRIASIGGVYHLTDGRHPSFAELSQAMASYLGRPPQKSFPLWMAKLLALAGDILGNRFPLNKERLQKICATLIFDDQKARMAFGWDPEPVLSAYKPD